MSNAVTKMDLHDDVLNIHYGALAKLSEGESNSLAIVMEVHFGDGIAHKAPDSPSIVEAEEHLTEGVSGAHWEEHIKHVNTKKSETILNTGLLDFPWHEPSLGSGITIEYSHSLSLHFDGSHWSIEFFLLNGGAFLRGSCEKSSWLEVDRLLVLQSYSF